MGLERRCQAPAAIRSSTGDVDKLPGQLSSWLMAAKLFAGEFFSANLHLSLFENSSTVSGHSSVPNEYTCCNVDPATGG